jgi:hypothetical protein
LNLVQLAYIVKLYVQRQHAIHQIHVLGQDREKLSRDLEQLKKTAPGIDMPGRAPDQPSDR